MKQKSTFIQDLKFYTAMWCRSIHTVGSNVIDTEQGQAFIPLDSRGSANVTESSSCARTKGERSGRKVKENSHPA